MNGAARLNGLPDGGTVDGRYGDHVLLAPPCIASEAELTLVVERLSLAMDAALAEA